MVGAYEVVMQVEPSAGSGAMRVPKDISVGRLTSSGSRHEEGLVGARVQYIQTRRERSRDSILTRAPKNVSSLLGGSDGTPKAVMEERLLKDAHVYRSRSHSSPWK